MIDDKSNKEKPLTEVFGIKLESERSDIQCYNIIRSIQFVLFSSHGLRDKIEIEESEVDDGSGNYYYTISNLENGLKVYVGRTMKDKKKLAFMFLDQSRIKWMKSEGFDMTEEECAKIGTIGALKDLFSLVRFLAGKKDFIVTGYCRKDSDG